VGHAPRVSIVLPTLNGARYIASAIESCLAQSFRDFEFVVVDDGSTDGTADIVRSFADPRIELLLDPVNTGRLPGALNLGFSRARGEFFTWFQDDDLYAPDALAALVRGLEANPAAGLVYAGQQFIDEEGALIRQGQIAPPEALAWTNPIGHCFLYRRAVAEAVGPYDESFLMAEDVHYWMRLYTQAPVVRLDGCCYSHRLHPNNLTGRGYGAYQALRVAARARREVLGLSQREYRRQVAAAFVEEAYAADGRADHRRVGRALLHATLHDGRSVARWPTIALWIRSLLHVTSRRSP
jgi:glycosyltransferase involved in cell wall biosynthesis